MTPKEVLLKSIKDGLANQTITETDLTDLLPHHQAVPVVTSKNDSPTKTEASKKVSVIDVLFYIAGIILFAALMVLTFQTGDNGPVAQVALTLGTGLLIWVVAYILGTRPAQNEVRKGLVNSLLLTGCLAVISGGFIAAYQVVGSNGAGASMAYAASVTLILLGAFHLVFDRIFRNIILIVLGVLLLSAAFPVTLVALLTNQNVPPDIWTIIGITTGLLIGYGGALASRTTTERAYLKGSFESVAAFLILSSLYTAIFTSSIAPLWEILLPLTIYLAFFTSIKRRSKNFLVTGSFFLVLFLITISFKYFSGLGAAFCLVLSAVSILATAFMASNINKRYIKQA